jgi:acetyl coenzyme A synthetase (ADP forming)-like protein
MTSATPELDVALKDGTTVHVRPVVAADEPRLSRLLGGLSKASLYLRFFAVPRTPQKEVARLLAADGEDDYALVAERAGTLVGVASYTRDPKAADRAEVAFAIADEVHGRGIGTQLLAALADVARAHEIRTFDANVLFDNRQMLRMLQDSGFAMRQTTDGSMVAVSIDLSAPGNIDEQSARRASIAAAASMRAFFEPKVVAVVGAGRARGKIGAEILYNLKSCGFRGQIFAVNPSARKIQQVPSSPRLTAVPAEIDLAIVCVPAAAVSAVVDDAIAKKVKAVVVITAGFAETGAAGRAVERELLARVRRAGIRMIGPNCMGVLNAAPDVSLNATFSPVFPPAGRVAMSTQSGALGLAILDYARQLNIGFSTFASVGNKADVSTNDLLQYWEGDANTDVILLYLESFGNPRRFSQIARRVSRTKPIVAVKAGRTTVGAQAASSHTGALAASDAVVDALFRQSGIIRTRTIEELFDVTALIAHQPIPPGKRVAIVTNAGGPGILAADACQAAGLELPPFSPRSASALQAMLPAAASIGNPVDMIASATADQYERAVSVLLDDDAIDSVVVVFVPPMVTKGHDVAAAIKRAAAARPGKPVLAVFMSSVPAPALLAPIPAYAFPESAAAALARACEYGAWRQTPAGTVPAFDDFDDDAVRAVISSVLARGGGWATPGEAARLLAAIRVSVAPQAEVSNADDAVAAARRLGYPVALKAVGPTIVHKTELGAVKLRLDSDADVSAAYHDLLFSLKAPMTGALVQPMAEAGVDMLIGCVEDPSFGPVVACGLGGTMTELIGDTSFRIAPLADRDAREMVDGLRAAAVLRGYRGGIVADEAALCDALLRVSAAALRHPELRELEINPLRLFGRGASALDVRVRVEAPTPAPPTRRVVY